MSNDKQETLYTLPQSYVEEMLADVDSHIQIALSNIKSALTGDEETKCYLALLVEYTNYNYGMKKLLSKELSETHMFFNEQTGKEEYVITQNSLLALQALVLGKHAAKKELNSFGFSMMLN
tara:strand:- start:81 stop:443 length:363 start_codon:yes stop_codon:yes gene_type:complete